MIRFSVNPLRGSPGPSVVGAFIVVILAITAVPGAPAIPGRPPSAPPPVATPPPASAAAPGAKQTPVLAPTGSPAAPGPTAHAIIPPVAAPAAPPDSTPAPTPKVERMALPDGLVLLSRENHAAPVVSVWVYYRVGSRDEVQGIFGISHQVEHMMFKGTERLRPGDIDRLFSERGGVNDAETTQDYTAYNETLPSSALDVALQVEADRMEHSAMAQSELSHEQNVVISELEGDENSPLYRLDTAVTASAFRAHPYHTPIGGYLYDVHGLTRREVERYYVDHYAPNNAVLVVVGDFKTSWLQHLVRQYFNAVPARAVTTHRITPEPPQEGEREVRLSGAGDSAYVEIAYHVPKTGEPDHYVMDVISTILAGGRSARLYRSLVEKGLASEVDAGDPDMKDPFLMQITASVAHGHTPAEVDAAITAELERLKTEPVSAEELQKNLNQVKASFVYRNDSVTSTASQIGLYAAILDWHYEDTYIDRIKSVTPAEIEQVAQRYFQPDNRTSGWFTPRPPAPGEAVSATGRAGAMHYHRTLAEPFRSRNLPLTERSPAASLPLQLMPGRGLRPAVRMARRLRRTRRPHAAAHTVPPLPDVFTPTPTAPPAHQPVLRRVLPNGLVLLVYPNHSNPDVAISGSIRAGAVEDPPGMAGLANFTAEMVGRGTESRTEDQIAAELDFVGASVEISASEFGAFFTGHSLKEDLPLTLSILSDEFMNASIRQPIFDRTANEIETVIRESSVDPATVAQQQLMAALYPPNYPLHWPVIGVTDSVRTITRDAVRDFYQKYYRPDRCIIVVVGDVNPEAAAAEIEAAFGPWKAAASPSAGGAPSMEDQIPTARQQTLVPGASESNVAMGFRGISRGDRRYYAAYLMNLILGNDDFNSRFMKDIRDRRGLVYYVGSVFDAGPVAGPWTLEMETSPSSVDSAVATATSDIRAMKQSGPTAAEIQLFKSWVTGNQALRLETDAGLADLLMRSEYYGLGTDYPWSYPALVTAVTKEQVRDAARDFLHPDNLVISVAGPTAPVASAAPAPAAPVSSPATPPRPAPSPAASAPPLPGPAQVH